MEKSCYFLFVSLCFSSSVSAFLPSSSTSSQTFLLPATSTSIPRSGVLTHISKDNNSKTSSKGRFQSLLHANKTKKSNQEKVKEQSLADESTSSIQSSSSETITDSPLPVRDPLTTDMAGLAEDKLPDGPIEDQLAVIDSRINQLINQGLYDPNAPIPEIKEKDALTRLTEIDEEDDDVPEDPFKDLPFVLQLVEEAKTLTFKSPGWIVKNTIVVNILVVGLLFTVFAFDELLSPLSRDFYNYHPQSVLDVPSDFGDWAQHVPERVGDYFSHFNYFEIVEKKEKLGGNYWGPLPEIKR